MPPSSDEGAAARRRGRAVMVMVMVIGLDTRVRQIRQDDPRPAAHD